MTDRVSYLGHATILLEIGATRILTDPVLTGRIMFIRRVGGVVPGRQISIGGVLISHAHQDHLHRASLRRVDRDTPIVAPVGLGSLITRWGFESVVELPVDGTVRLGDVSVTAVPAVHSGYRPPSGPRAEAIGYLVQGPGVTIYFAGDTDLFEGMSGLGDPGIDLALLPVWGWGPRLGAGHLDPERAAEAVARLRPRVAIPIHWGTLWPVAVRWRRHQLTEPPLAFAREVERRGIPSQVVILAPGESAELPGTTPSAGDA